MSTPWSQRLKEVIGYVTKMDYNMDILTHPNIHPIFHMHYLKKVVGLNWKVRTNLPELDEDGSILNSNESSFGYQKCQLNQHTIFEILI